MNYHELADEFLNVMSKFMHTSYQKQLISLNCGEMSILNYLYHQPTGVKMSELCRNLEVSAPRMTAVLNSLVKKNWVTRCRDNADGRCVMVRITEIGRAIILQKHEQLLLKIASSFSALNEKDAVAYVRITQEMLQYFNQN